MKILFPLKTASIPLIFILLYIFLVFLIDIHYIYEIPSTILNVGYRAPLMSVSVILSVFYFFAYVFNKKKMPVVVIYATFFAFWSAISTLVNYYKYEDLHYIIPVQIFWWGILFLSFHFSKRFSSLKTFYSLLTIFFLTTFFYYMRYALDPSSFGIYAANKVNSVYYVTFFLPFIFCLRQNLFKYLFIILTLYASFISEKRTGFITIVFSLSFYFIIEMFFRSSFSYKKKVLIFLFITVLSFLSIYLYEHVYESQGSDVVARIDNIEEDEGSGRIDIYKSLLYEITRLDFYFLLAGNGFNSVLLSTNIGHSAHNDFLEVLYDFGIVGLILYLLFIYQILKYWVFLFKKRDEYFGAFTASIIMFFGFSMTSHLIIYPSYFILLIIFWMWQINRIKQKYFSEEQLLNEINAPKNTAIP